MRIIRISWMSSFSPPIFSDNLEVWMTEWKGLGSKTNLNEKLVNLLLKIYSATGILAILISLVVINSYETLSLKRLGFLFGQEGMFCFFPMQKQNYLKFVPENKMQAKQTHLWCAFFRQDSELPPGLAFESTQQWLLLSFRPEFVWILMIIPGMRVGYENPTDLLPWLTLSSILSVLSWCCATCSVH